MFPPSLLLFAISGFLLAQLQVGRLTIACRTDHGVLQKSRGDEERTANFPPARLRCEASYIVMTDFDIEWFSCGAALVDPETTEVLQCNSAFTHLTNVSKGQVVEKILATKLEPGTTVNAPSSRGPNKMQRWIEVQTKSVRDGAAWFVQVVDISKQIEADQRSTTFLELSFDGFWDWRIQEDYEYMSPRFWEIFGYEAEEKEHKPSAWQNMIFKDDLAAATTAFVQHCETRGRTPYCLDVRYRHKNGSTVVVNCQGRVIEWDEETGAAIRMIGTHTDITKLRQKHKADIERKVQEYLAHQVRNPLTSAVAATRFLRLNIGQAKWENSKVQEESERDMHILYENLMSISSVIGRLVELNRIYADNSAVSLARTNVESQVLRPVQAMSIGDELLPTAAAVETSCEEPLIAQTDPLRLKQILFRLVKSASANLKQGTVKIVASKHAADNGNSIQIAVRSFGIPHRQKPAPSADGVESAEAATAGDGVNQITSHGAGSFHIAATLANMLGAKLTRSAITVPESSAQHSTVASPGGGGGGQKDEATSPSLDALVWEAYLIVPGLITATDVAPEEKQELDAYYHNSRVLFIDDEPVIRKLTVRRLGSLIPNSQVDAAASGEEALQLVAKHDYRLIMVDHYMPGPKKPLTGAETICQLRLLGVEAPIIGCSGNDVSVLHMEAGADSFIQKPTPPDAALIGILNSCVPKPPTAPQ